MAPSNINVLLSSFPGLGLPRTTCLHAQRDGSISSLVLDIFDRLPRGHRYIITTTGNRHLSSACDDPISTLLGDPSSSTDILSLRLTVPLCGGKGGFGSQLRAQGGRMASRKKRQPENNGSSRNLDGRRLRTVSEAKSLAQYLDVKPGMDKKKKEESRKRWEKIVDMCELKEDEIRHGQAKVDPKWLEQKDEMEKKTRDIVERAMAKARQRKDEEDIRKAKEAAGEAEEEDDDEDDSEASSESDEEPFKSAWAEFDDEGSSESEDVEDEDDDEDDESDE